MVTRTVADGETLMRQGDEADALYVIAAGDVRVDVRRDDGSNSILADLGPGSVVGEMALLTRQPRTADVFARGETIALELTRKDFEELALDHPEVSVVLTEIVTERLGGTALDSLGGKEVGGHLINKCIGRGGMAVVYEATSLESDEQVALKMMNHRLLFQAGARARFHREADLLLKIDHPGVTRVTGRFDAYRTSFLVMEYCDGPSLDLFLEQHGACDEESTRHMLGQLCSALQHLHTADVVHRDLKPANVLLTTRGEAKMTDFGLAKPGHDSGSTSLTREGAIMGTPRYMAPELFTGMPATAAADLYSLGCLGVELLSGRKLFDMPDISLLIDAKLRWSGSEIDELLPEATDEIRALLAQLTAREPDDRTAALEHYAGWAAPFAPMLDRRN